MNNPYYKYSITFHEFYNSNKEWLNEKLAMSSATRTNALLESLRSIWGVYEISGETVGEFKLFLLDTFLEYKRYYEEMLDNYDKEFDFSDGIPITTVTSNNASVDTTNLNVDLPNKVVSKDSYFDYPSSALKSNSDSSNERTNTVTDNARFITLKTQYMKQIRDLYREFAYKFSDCFIHIY